MTTLREFVDDPARRAKAQEQQAELRARFGASLNRHPAELSFVYGVDRELMVFHQLTALADQPESQEKTRHVDHLYNSLAEGLSYQGRFHEAAVLTKSPEHAREYAEKAKALENFGVRCACPDEMVFPSNRDAKGLFIPARVKVEEVFDGQFRIALTRCLICNGLVATKA